jgi:monoamine oxidase
LAGLVAARELRAAGLGVSVLEARDRVGGRVLNATTSDGTVVELGGQWIGPTQDRIIALIDGLGLQRFPTYNTGDNLVHDGRRLRHYRGAIPRLSPHVLADIGQAQLRLDSMARRVPLDEPWAAKKAQVWDGQTVETWIRRNLGTGLAREMLRLGVRAVFAAEAADMSLLHFLFYSHSGGLLDRLFNVEGGAQEQRVVGGTQLVAQRLAGELDGAVTTGAAIRRISQQGAVVVVESSDAESVSGSQATRVSLSARRVVVAVPPAIAGRIDVQPALPARRDQLTQRMPMGSVIKCMAVYEEAFWRAEGLTGQATDLVGPAQLTFDNSPPSGRPGVMLAFVEGAHARELSRCTTDERRRRVVECLVRCFGSEAEEPLEFLHLDWSAERFSGGCYGAHLPPGVLSGYGPALRQSCGSIHWAGTETSPVWAGYMDGAVRSGERVAREIVASLSERSR